MILCRFLGCLFSVLTSLYWVQGFFFSTRIKTRNADVILKKQKQDTEDKTGSIAKNEKFCAKAGTIAD